MMPCVLQLVEDCKHCTKTITFYDCVVQTTDRTEEQVTLVEVDFFSTGEDKMAFRGLNHLIKEYLLSLFLQAIAVLLRCQDDRASMPRPRKYISQTPEPMTIGTTKFRPVTSREKKYIEKNKKFWTNTREWSIDYGKFDKYKWKQTLEVTESAGIENLWLNNNGSKEVLRSLAPCAFINLKILNLNANQIQSLEPISLLQAPKLERIEVNDNQITQIKPLRKTIFDNISWISLCNNPVNDWFVLAEIYAPRLQRLDLRRIPFFILDDSLNWMLKMESRQIRKLDATALRRIPQRQVKEMIYERYVDICIEWTAV